MQGQEHLNYELFAKSWPAT